MTPVNFAWLIRLRWAAIAGQAATIAGVVELLNIDLPLLPLGAILCVELLSNVAVMSLARRRTVRAWWAGALMAFDTLLLTALLFFSGGPFNPFSFLYLVQIALATLILPARWTWALAGLALAGSGFLFVDYRELPLEGLSHAGHMRMHLRGMWVAFGVATVFIVYFLVRVRAELTAARALAERRDKLASLATLAAGAAHELSTPLSTIALVARELERQAGASPLSDDARLIRAEVDRCRAILDRLAADAGTNAGEAPVDVAVADVVGDALAAAARPVLSKLDGGLRVRVPRRAVAVGLTSLVNNALDADAAPPTVQATASGDSIRIDVCDRGPGMAPEVLGRVGEPFFTTKPAGRGMGLGVFLTRAIVESAGGRLDFDSAPGRGTTASLTLPRAP